MKLEAVNNLTIDAELKEQVKPFLETIFKAQPQTVINTYPKTVVEITMSKSHTVDLVNAMGWSKVDKEKFRQEQSRKQSIVLALYIYSRLSIFKYTKSHD